MYLKIDSKCTRNPRVRATVEVLDTLSLIVHTYNCNTRRQKQKDYRFKASLGYIDYGSKKQVTTNETKTMRRKQRFWTLDLATTHSHDTESPNTRRKLRQICLTTPSEKHLCFICAAKGKILFSVNLEFLQKCIN